MSRVMWVEKYRPRKVDDIIGNNRARSEFLRWLREWKPRGKAALLYGPPGVGKTTLVRVAAQEFGYGLIEMNASDVRTKEKIMRIAGRAATESSLESALSGVMGTLIFLDEVDGVFGREDRGGIAAVLRVIKVAHTPVVLAANNPWDPRLRYMRGPCRMIRFYGIRLPTLVAFLRRICRSESVRAEEEALRVIAEKAEGDVRSAINDLQAFAEGRQVLRAVDLDHLAPRDRQQNVFDTLRTLFSSRTHRQAEKALRESELNPEMLLQCVHDNLPLQLQDSEKLAEAYDALSRADIIFGRVQRGRSWRLQRYAVKQIASGVVSAGGRGYRYVRHRFPPTKISLMSRTKAERGKRKGVCARIGSRCHVSRRVANRDFIPFLKVVFKNDPVLASQTAQWLSLGKDDIEYLAS